MPDHVHAVVWFPYPDQVSLFVKQWKQRTSFQIKRLYGGALSSLSASFDSRDPVWQPGYYDFNIFSEKKLLEKLAYMHANPVKAGLARSPCDWQFSTARCYERNSTLGRSFGPDDL